MPAATPRALTVMADGLLAAACEHDREVLDEKLFLEIWGDPAAQGGRADEGLPDPNPADLEDRPSQQQWPVDGLWARQAVGIVGGEPKCGKSFLALDLAVAVAAGVPCLRRFAAAQQGPVLLFAAEDAGHIVRRRLEGIARAAGAAFETLDIAVIDVPKRERLSGPISHRKRVRLSRPSPSASSPRCSSLRTSLTASPRCFAT